MENKVELKWKRAKTITNIVVCLMRPIATLKKRFPPIMRSMKKIFLFNFY